MESKTMKKATTSINALASVSSISEMKEVAWEEVKKSFESFCLMAGVESLTKMFEEDAEKICGPRYGRGSGKRGHRWGTTRGKVGFHGGTIDVDRPRVRDRKGKEIPLPSWEAARDAGFLKQWAMNLTLMNVAMRKFGRAVRLPDAKVPATDGSGLSKSAVSRRFVALTQQKLTDWMSSDLSKLDLVVIQIDGMHLDDNRLGLPPDLRRSLACTNIIESMNSIIRQVCRNVKRWRNAKMGLRWTAAGMLEAKKGFRRLKAHKHLPVLKAALQNHRSAQSATPAVDRLADAA
jgi:transposase-like protein